MAIAVQPQQLPSKSVINGTWVTKLVINQIPPKEVLVFVSLEEKNVYLNDYPQRIIAAQPQKLTSRSLSTAQGRDYLICRHKSRSL